MKNRKIPAILVLSRPRASANPLSPKFFSPQNCRPIIGSHDQSRALCQARDSPCSPKVGDALPDLRIVRIAAFMRRNNVTEQSGAA